ncbi:MAG: prepilin-type N-terminal cleavage/methylation domain-containing protein [Acidimicrobiaceae bacterium]|nr:prepilin-type N-terminal cleavage/methylation domain-containing protein [Acidimicrobiaceae bacterium]
MNNQRGLTLVELVVALSIMSFLLLGLGSVLFIANNAVGLWSQQVTEGETLNQLSGTLEQDLRLYAPCRSQPPGELYLCIPRSEDQSPLVTYSRPSKDLVRRVTGGSTVVVARGLSGSPSFVISPCTPGGVDSGSVTVQGLLYPGQDKPRDLVVYFRSPGGEC